MSRIEPAEADSASTVYLDHAATTPLAPEVFEVMSAALRDGWGNPSSHHAAGRAARSAVDSARDTIAAAIGAEPREIVFVSGGSEADNLALRGPLDRWPDRGRHVVISAIEHDAVLKTASGLAALGRAEVTVVPCDRGGIVDPEAFAAEVREDTVVASLMLANNEVGTVQDVARAAQLIRARNPRTLIHTDAVQALGRLSVDVRSLDVDLLTITAHKAYGPKGVGALYVRQGVVLSAQISGGGQERNRRSGTENVASIAGFARAVTIVEAEREHEMTRQQALIAALRDGIVGAVPGAVVTGEPRHQLANFATFAIPGVPTEVLLTALDRCGVFASGGSACSSGANMPSHVLIAMGYAPDVAACALRCTVGRGTTAAQVSAAVAAIADVVKHAVAVGSGRVTGSVTV